MTIFVFLFFTCVVTLYFHYYSFTSTIRIEEEKEEEKKKLLSYDLHHDDIIRNVFPLIHNIFSFSIILVYKSIQQNLRHSI